MSSNEIIDKMREAIFSAAIVRDIIKRHTYAEVEENEIKCKCCACHKEILINATVYLVRTFDGKSLMTLCGKDCCNEHEYQEFQRYGCEAPEMLPPIAKYISEVSRGQLLQIYLKRSLIS